MPEDSIYMFHIKFYARPLFMTKASHYYVTLFVEIEEGQVIFHQFEIMRDNQSRLIRQ